MKLSILKKFLFAAACIGSAGLVHAQSFPTKPVSLVVPYPAGGPSDFFARKVQPEAAAKLGQSVIVENLGGAGGSIGMTKVLNAPADGHTLALGSPIELVLAPLAIQGVKYKPEDVKVVGQIVKAPLVLLARKDLPASRRARSSCMCPTRVPPR